MFVVEFIEAVRPWVMWAAFVATYLGLAVGRWPVVVTDRAGIALVGAAVMMLVGGLSLSQAVSAEVMDYKTLLLLFGLMLFSARLEMAGLYGVVAGRLRGWTGRPGYLLAGVILVSAGLSAVVTNDVVCIAMTPIVCRLTMGAGVNPLPHLIALATAANIGSAATLIGNPQNIYIRSMTEMGFAGYTAAVLPAVVVCLAVCWGVVWWVYGKTMRVGAGVGAGVAAGVAAGEGAGEEARVGWAAMVPTLVLLGVVMGVFCVADSATSAVAAAVGGVMLLVSRHEAAKGLLDRVDWRLLLLFVGLFVVNGAMKERGLMEVLFGPVRGAVDLTDEPTLAGVTLVLSNLVSNVPAVLLLEQQVEAGRHDLWRLIAFVATVAGNLTLVGSIANLIVAESAKRHGVEISLWEYCRVGVPLTVVTVGLSTVWLMYI